MSHERTQQLRPTLLARGVSKAFGAGNQRTVVLQGVDLEAYPGETVFLVGPSGSGKTTLLSVLGCILTPDSGQLEVLGQDVATMDEARRAGFRRDRLGFIFQTFNLFPTLSALDNVALALTMRGEPLRAAQARAEELLDQVGLGHRKHTRPAKLSGGECQRVAVARALTGDPDLIFADEPTASLDADNGQAVMALLTDLVRQRGGTLVVVTHDSRIFHFARRGLVLEDGRVIHEWRPDQLGQDGPAAGHPNGPVGLRAVQERVA